MNKSIYFLLIILGCAIHEPRETVSPPEGEKIERILENTREKSFKVRIKLSRPGAKYTIYGEYDKRGRIKIRNEWEIDSKKIEEESLVIGDETFLKEDNEWVEGSSSGQLPHKLMLTITSFGDFYFIGMEKGCFVYEFTPNLLFISPFMEGAEAQIYIDEHTLLPVNIVAEGNGVSFSAKFSCFDENIKIEHPFSRIYETKILPLPDPRDMNIITKRIIFLGADNCWLRNDKLYIKTPEANKEDMRKILKKGMIYIYTATYLKEPLAVAKDKYGDKLVFLNNTNPILIDSLLYQGVAEDVEFLEGGVRGDRIVLKFSDDIILLTPCVISIDDRPVSILQKFYGKELKIKGDRIDYSILKFGPLSKEYGIK
ncbi:MAG: hypothetical protein U9R01_08390 [candidate division WOR-3 bacterium]|nr:hypothetical protein [candidate division WOR-3 bacterium]